MTDEHLEPRLKLTVPMTLWLAFAKTINAAYADSYLSGANLTGDELTPRTRTGWDRLRMRAECVALLNSLGIKLIQPVIAADTLNRAWTRPTDAELDRMPLKERRRQFTIMATEAETMAGHMRDDGTHAAPEWLDIAANYRAEIKRIAALIAKGAQRHAAE